MWQASLGVAGGGDNGGAGGGTAATALAGTTDGGVVDWRSVLDLQSGHPSSTAASACAKDPFYYIFNTNNMLFFLYQRATRLRQDGMKSVEDHLADGLRHPFEPHAVLAWFPRRTPDWGPLRHTVSFAVAVGRLGWMGAAGRGTTPGGASSDAVVVPREVVAQKIKAPAWPVSPPSDGVVAELKAAATVSLMRAGGRVPP